MQKETQTYRLIKWLVVAADLVVMNAALLIVAYASTPEAQDVFRSHAKVGILVCNMLYLFCAGVLVPPIIQMRKVRPEQVVGRVVVMLSWFAVLSFLTIQFVSPMENLFWTWVKFYVLMVVCNVLSRLLMRFFIKKFRRNGRNTRDVLFVGSLPDMAELYQEMMGDPTTGFRVVGYFDDVENMEFGVPAPYLGTLDSIYHYLEHSHFRPTGRVYCCLPLSRKAEILQLIKYCDNHLIRFYSVPSVHSYVYRSMLMELEGDVPVLYMREEPLRKPINRLMKRTFDICVSALFLCTLFPFVYLVVALITKITSPGPVFFKQKRNGLNGAEFYCYKFRSMKVNAQSDTLQATEHDPRKTKFGNFLRKSSIDELPQFINVLRGEMSIVGPRPHMLKHTEEYSKLIDKYMVRHYIKPGITGWAQVNGCRGETKELSQMEARIKKDIWYVEHWSMWLDLRIMYLTVWNALHGEKNAY